MECFVGPLVIILPLILVYYLSRANQTKLTARIERLEEDVLLLGAMLNEQSVNALDDSENLVPQDVLDPVEDAPITQGHTSSLDLSDEAPAEERALPPVPALAPQMFAPVLETAEPQTFEQVDAGADKDRENDEESDWSLPLIGWFLRSNILVQIGIVILFIGIGFLLKYVADLGLLSLGMRHVAVAAGGVVLTGIGWFLRKKARFYGLALQGAGLGILYLTTFFAFSVYGLIPAGLAFPILVALGVICAGMAVFNDARVLAFLAVIGAFLAPILASDGGGNHVMLFSYYAVVNIAVLAIAWFKAWRSLNLASFFFTLAAGLLWGIDSYNRDLFGSTEPFVILFFGFFLLIAILYGWRKAADPTATRIDLIDTTIVFGTPFSIFAVQSILMQPFENGIGLSAAAMGAIYAILGVIFLLRDKRWLRDQADQSDARHPLTEAFLFLSFFFLALSVPLLFEPKVTTATWAVSGAIWVWMGTQRQRNWNRLFGLLVQLGAGIFFVWDYAVENLWLTPVDSSPFLNPYYIGSVLLAGAGLFSAYHLWRGKQTMLESDDAVMSVVGRWPIMSALVMTWGLLWWFGGGVMQILELFMPYGLLDSLEQLFDGRTTVPENLWTALLLFVAGSAALFELSGRQLRWNPLRRPMLLLLPVLIIFSLIQLVYVPHHFAGLGWLIWPAVLALYYWILLQQQADFGTAGDSAEDIQPLSGFSLGHAGAFWLITFLLTWFAGWFAYQQTPNDTWVISAVIAVPSLLIFLTSARIDSLPQPFRTQRNAYLGLGIVPVVLFVLCWSLLAHGTNSGDLWDIPYIPLLNPLDLAQIGLFAALFVWLRKHPQPVRRILGRIWGVLGFIALNWLIARAVHHTMGVPFTWDDLFYFAPLQMIYSVLWGTLAMVLMFWSRRNGQRILWGSGAVILALTIAKLFLVDLANSDSIGRIVSFIGVGLLVMIIAYFAPAPQRQNLEETAVLSEPE